jgi:hypothetical protein
MHAEDRQRQPADPEPQLEAVAPEDARGGIDTHLGQRRGEEPELLEGDVCMAHHLLDFDRLAVRRLLAQHDGDIDTPPVIARRGEFVPVAGADHLVEIAIFEGLQRGQIVDLLQADDVGPRRRDGERRKLTRVVGMGQRACHLQKPVIGLLADLEQRQRAVL